MILNGKGDEITKPIVRNAYIDEERVDEKI